ncbi:MAG: hypothetical protein SCK29_07660 [Bacillota bacterium]|nr:hypothetical protein [Bacillota bacterium]MDW7683976.1 hypothetical protein [Bacillota bacterium]
MLKIMAVITLGLLAVTMGCGFAITYGGESFQNAAKGDMVLGTLTFVSLLALVAVIFKQ